MPDVAIISASYGDYDTVKQPLPQADVDAEWVLVTDSLELHSEWKLTRDNPEFAYGATQWRVVYEPRPDETPFRAAKHPKFQPWKYTAAPVSIWIDGSVRVTDSLFAAEVMERLSESTVLLDNMAPIAQFSHFRGCIYDEARASLSIRKYQGEPIEAQVAHYRSAGHPKNWGVWATTVVARKHTNEIQKLGEAWEAEGETWSSQDQVSQPFVLRNLGLRPAVLPGLNNANPWLHMATSRAHNASNRGVREGADPVLSGEV